MRLRYAVMTLALLLFCVSPALAGGTTYGWSETGGWLDYAPANGGATVYSDHLEGYVWQENIGWVSLGSHSGGGVYTYLNTGAADWGVNRGVGGALSGYAWSDTGGWINFNPAGGGVTYNAASGRLSGWAWGENIGWVRFYPLTRVITASAGSNGAITPAGATTVLAEIPAVFSIIPAAGYHLVTPVGGTCGGAITSGDTYDTVNGVVYTTTAGSGGCTVAAAFAKTYTVTPSAGGNGSISPATPRGMEYNATATFTIKPATGYHLVTPVGGSCPAGTITGSPYDSVNGVSYTTGAVTSDCTVDATFSNAATIYNITISTAASAGGYWSGTVPDIWTPATGGAHVSVAEIQSRLNAGTGVTITANPGGTAGESGDITVVAPVSWSAGKLTLTAVNNININAVMTPSGSSTLDLTATSGAVRTAAGGKVNFDRSGSGLLTINGAAYTVINALGSAGSVTGTDLQGISGALSGNYALGADIAASATSTWNSNTGFLPLGNATTQFTGIFDGLGHTITGLAISRPGTDYVGLFGATGGATLRNVGLVNASVSGRSYVGGLVGQSGYKPASTVLSSAISNAYTTGGTVTGSVIVQSYYTGGLVGWDFAGPIDTCFSSATVQGNVHVGGLAGSIYDGDINHCRISNSYSNGTVHGKQYVGGLVGYSWGYLSSVYSSGFVSADNSIGVGGLVGAGITGIYLTNSFWDTQTSGQSGSGGGTGKTSAEMKNIATFTGWDISASGNEATIWRIYDGQSYPLLRSFLAPLTVTADDKTKTEDGGVYSGGYTYSTSPVASLLGTASYAGASQTATAVGSYSIIPGGLYSNQLGYDISFINGVLTITAPPPSYTLNISFAGTGGNKVESTSPDHGINCLKGSSSGCGASYTSGTAVTLGATPDWKSSFTGWSANAPAGVVTMDSNKTVTATFGLADRVKLSSKATEVYASIRDACDAAAISDTIKAQEYFFQETSGVTIGATSAKNIIFKGGYALGDSSFNAITGVTSVQGPVKIQSGSLTVDGLAIR